MSETIFDRDPIAAKALALSESIINSAMLMVHYLKIAYPKKRPFQKIDRRPLKRINKNRAKAKLLMALPMGAMQVAMIASQPVPKYECGGVSGIVGQTGKAEIINVTHE